MDLLSTYKFVKSYLGHLENINSLRQIFQMLTYFIILNKKSYLKNIPVPSRMSLLDVNLTVTDMSYPTFQFSPENVNFIIDNKYCQ